MNHIERARQVLDIEIAGLNKVRDALGTGLNEAVELLAAHLADRGKIVITGVGKSLHIGQKIAATFTSTGAPAFVLHPAEAMHGDLGVVQPGDVMLAFSYSGASVELSEMVPLVKRLDVPIIAITGESESELTRHSDVVISVAVDREACPFNMAPTASTTAMLAIGDALAMALLDARGFKKEDFAKLHPGGSIGRTLLLRARDIMRSGDRIARVARKATVRDAVLAMTGARAGSVAVLDGDDRVIGIVTDGDLRRHIADGVDVGALAVADIMTPDPITRSTDDLAVEVLRVYEEHNIDDLLIVDEAGKLAGMVDIQDLPKFKIL